jgi:hypothetical protein
LLKILVKAAKQFCTRFFCNSKTGMFLSPRLVWFLLAYLAMLNQDQFNLLTHQEKCFLVRYDAIRLAERKLAERFVVFYQLHSFYVELWHHGKEDEVLLVRSFNNTNQLEPYLQAININHLLA